MKMIILSFGILLAFCGLAVGQTSGQWLVQCSETLVKKEYQVAVAKCTKAIDAQPDSVDAFQLRASAYEKIAYYSAAIGDYTSLIRLTKGAAKFHFYRAELYSKRIENQKAIDDYTSVIAKEPTGPFTAKAFYGRGVIYDKVGRKAAAQADYESAVKLDPGYAEAKKKIEYPFGNLTITQAADNIIPGIPPTMGMTDKGAETKPKPFPTSSPSVTVKTSPTKLLPERQPTPAEDERLEKIISWRDSGVKPTADDIVWASSYIFEQIKYLKNRDKGDRETAEKISGLYLNHGALRGSLLDFKGEIVDLTNCLVYSPKDHWCTVSRVYAYLADGNKPLALADANKIVALQPQWTLAYKARAAVHCAMGNKSVALADERKVIELGDTVTTPCK
jgi:tetratricopeptide (TPR) repeat protein